MPDDEAGFPDMMEPAYILFDSKGSGEFAFGGDEATRRGNFFNSLLAPIPYAPCRRAARWGSLLPRGSG